jgi:hypothetical protein
MKHSLSILSLALLSTLSIDTLSSRTAHAEIGSGLKEIVKAKPAYVQNAIIELGSGPTSPVQSAAFGSANKAGNTIVAFTWLAYSSTAPTFTGASDSQSNTYAQTVTPTTGEGGICTIYYAYNIKGGSSNKVSFTYTGTGTAAVLYAMEYSGISQYDNGAVGSGSSATSSSGNFTTHQVGLLVGFNVVANDTNSAGTGFTSRLITGGFGDILEDDIGAAIGTNAATANITNGAYIMAGANFY